MANEMDEETEEEMEDVEEVAQTEEMRDNFLVPRQTYLASGVHIGMKQKSQQMKRFIYKIRPDGLAVMNIQMIDDRLRIAAKFLAKQKKIVIVSRRNIGHKAIEKFAEALGGDDTHAITGRFMPGTLTNPHYKEFFEADAVLVVDPIYDYQSLKEAKTSRIPVVALSGTSNEISDIDIIIPSNNKSMKSISTLFWILAREILKERGSISSDDEFKYNPSDFAKEEFGSGRTAAHAFRGRGRDTGRGSGRESDRGSRGQGSGQGRGRGRGGRVRR